MIKINPTIGIFLHHPECSEDCIQGMRNSLESKYNIVTFSEEDCNPERLKQFDMIAFPGGIGDASSYDRFFRRKAQNAVADYVTNGGKYLGICMGAYWAGSYYFDILEDIDAVQYIKRDTAEIKRPYGTVANITWNGKQENMYFYDGCALIGDESKCKVIARYDNKDAMAIIQKNIGIIGCHPESLEYWYKEPWQYINQYWHEEKHHKLLLEFVDELMSGAG